MRKALKTKTYRRRRLHKRVRGKISGTKERPRLTVFLSNQHIYAQIIDDDSHQTLVGAFSTEKAFEGKKVKANKEGAAEIGKVLAERAQKKEIKKVVFDRGGVKYHGKVKALADAAREQGLEF